MKGGKAFRNLGNGNTLRVHLWKWHGVGGDAKEIWYGQHTALCKEPGARGGGWGAQGVKVALDVSTQGDLSIIFPMNGTQFEVYRCAGICAESG